MSALSSDTLNYDDHVDLAVEDFLLKNIMAWFFLNVPSNIVKCENTENLPQCLFILFIIVEFVPTMGEVADFSMDIPFPVIDVPSLGFPNLEEACQSRLDSDISDSCPASPSPASSPSPLCSSSSSESGIEDGSDMEEASTFAGAPTGGIMLKNENPLSPLNSLNEALESGNGRKRNRRNSCKQTSHVSSVLAELNKLLVQTSMSATSTSMGTSLPLQSHPVVTGLDPLACIQTTATTTKASLSCPMSVQATGQVDAFVQSVPISSSSQMVGSVTSVKMSTSPPVASQSKTRSKQARNSRKLDEPKIVIVEEPEEVNVYLYSPFTWPSRDYSGGSLVNCCSKRYASLSSPFVFCISEHIFSPSFILDYLLITVNYNQSYYFSYNIINLICYSVRLASCRVFMIRGWRILRVIHIILGLK